MTANPLITPRSAREIALECTVTTEPYRTVVTEAGGTLMTLRLVRVQVHPDGHTWERSHEITVSRAQTTRDYANECRRKWAYLRLMHERTDERESA